MDRAEFEHTIRTAGIILNETEILVIGSQAIHASTLNIPEVAERSMEGDFAAFDDPLERKADLLDGTVGEASMFHDMFGYYIQGVTRSTAVLPQGWRIGSLDTKLRTPMEWWLGASIFTTFGYPRPSPGVLKTWRFALL